MFLTQILSFVLAAIERTEVSPFCLTQNGRKCRQEALRFDSFDGCHAMILEHCAIPLPAIPKTALIYSSRISLSLIPPHYPKFPSDRFSSPFLPSIMVKDHSSFNGSASKTICWPPLGIELPLACTSTHTM